MDKRLVSLELLLLHSDVEKLQLTSELLLWLEETRVGDRVP